VSSLGQRWGSTLGNPTPYGGPSLRLDEPGGVAPLAGGGDGRATFSSSPHLACVLGSCSPALLAWWEKMASPSPSAAMPVVTIEGFKEIDRFHSPGDPHIEYVLLVTHGDGMPPRAVQRRYREFIALQKDLGASYASYKLPPKRPFSNNDAVTSERTVSLQQYLSGVLAVAGSFGSLPRALEAFLGLDVVDGLGALQPQGGGLLPQASSVRAPRAHASTSARSVSAPPAPNVFGHGLGSITEDSREEAPRSTHLRSVQL
jgi:hypothetical protein